MNKAQLIDRLSVQLGSKKAATDAVEAVVDTITRAVASGEQVAITGFGVFEKVARPARTGRNPRTGCSREDQEDHGAEVQGRARASRTSSAAPRSCRRSRSPLPRRPRARRPAKKTTAKKTAAKKTTPTKTAAKKTAVKAPAKKAPAKKAPAKKAAAKKTTARSASQQHGSRARGPHAGPRARPRPGGLQPTARRLRHVDHVWQACRTCARRSEPRKVPHLPCFTWSTAAAGQRRSGMVKIVR